MSQNNMRRFFGNLENAVKGQVWIAVSTFALVAIVGKRPKVDLSLQSMLQVLSVKPFEKTPPFQMSSATAQYTKPLNDDNQ